MTEMTWTCEKCTNQTGNVVRQLSDWPKDAVVARGCVRAAFVCCDCAISPETAENRKNFAKTYVKKPAQKFMDNDAAMSLVATAQALAMSQ